MATNVDTKLRSVMDSFAADVTSIIEGAVDDAVRSALKTASNGTGRANGTSRRGRPPGKASKRTAASNGAAGKKAKKASAGGMKKGKRTKGGWVRRSPEYLADLERRLLAEIKRKGDQRIEQISDSLGEPTRNLTLPAKKLIAAKKVRTKGQKRATRYSAA